MQQALPPVAPGQRRRRALGTVAALLAGGAAYVGACALVPMPAPAVTLEVPATQSFAVDDAPAQAAVDAEPLPTAVGWLDGEAVWSNDDSAQPLASITKLVTAVIGQEAEPIAAGDPGPTYTWSEADVERQEAFAELDGIVFPIPVGTEISRRDMLTLALVPSANDFADAYAYSIFGDNERFTAAAAEWAEREGLTSLRISEPSGMDDGNVANAADVLRLARIVLDDPVLAEIVGTSRASFPWGIGEVENSNPLLEAMPGALGVKTGHTDTAGYSLAAAAHSEFGDRELTGIAVALGRGSEDERAADARELLTLLAELPEDVEAASDEEALATLTAADGQTVGLRVAGGYSEVLVPGETLTRSIEVGGAEDSVVVSGPRGAREVAVVREGTLSEPSLWWRITHPRELATR